MAYYNANEVIRLTRNALDLTQEQLSEGICEVITLSRIENGHHSVKRSTYRQLMERMGRLPDTRYAICIDKDGVLSEDRLELERAFKRYDYEAAEYYLKRLKEKADDNLLTRQYIFKANALVSYRLKRIDESEFIEVIEKSMCYGCEPVVSYEQYIDSEKVFPYTKMELLLLTNLAGAYRENGNLEKSIMLYNLISRCLYAKYLGAPDCIRMQITVKNSLAMAYEMAGKYYEAIKELDLCLNLAKKYDYGHTMPTLISAKSFNIIKLVNAGKLEKECVEEAKHLSQQAYYIAAARGDVNAMRMIREFIEHYI